MQAISGNVHRRGCYEVKRKPPSGVRLLKGKQGESGDYQMFTMLLFPVLLFISYISRSQNIIISPECDGIFQEQRVYMWQLVVTGVIPTSNQEHLQDAQGYSVEVTIVYGPVGSRSCVRI